MPRGGRRQGTPGTAYSNRTDLNDTARQPVRVPTGQPYGEAGKQAAMQQAAPLPQAPRPPLPAFDAPTQRPSEPLTAGLPIGAGPGPEALPFVGEDNTLLRLRAIYQAHPNEELRGIIEELES